MISLLFLFACTGTSQKVQNSSDKSFGLLIVMDKCEIKSEALEDIDFKKYSQNTNVKNDIQKVSELYIEITEE